MPSLDTPWGPAPGEVLTVAELLSKARLMLEQAFPWVWVEGEIGNARVPASGHAYFSLGDEAAQVRAVCFRSTLRLLGLTPRDGLRVLARGRLTLYEARGDIQLVVEDLEPLGAGLQRLALEERKRKLAAEGLFAVDRKRALPFLPEKVGVVTSEGGAALRDILNVLGRRAPGVPVVVAPARVQGQEAPGEIVRALALLCSRPGVDVIIVGRGGGAAEDLSAFDDEEVVRAVARCPVPVISAVGHETDVPLVDFAADVRAPTPSAAAELAVRDWTRLQEQLGAAASGLRAALTKRLSGLRRRMDGAQKRLQAPQSRIDRRRIGLDRVAGRLGAAEGVRVRCARSALARLEKRALAASPETRLASVGQRVLLLRQRIEAAGLRLVETRRHALRGLDTTLEALNPGSVLARGYAIARAADGAVLRDAGSCSLGQGVQVSLARGSLGCVVSEVHPGS